MSGQVCAEFISDERDSDFCARCAWRADMHADRSRARKGKGTGWVKHAIAAATFAVLVGAACAGPTTTVTKTREVTPAACTQLTKDVYALDAAYEHEWDASTGTDAEFDAAVQATVEAVEAARASARLCDSTVEVAR